MALLFLDSFDHYATADRLEKYAGSSGTIVAAAGRRASACLRIAYGDSVVTRTFAPTGTTVVLGVALKVSGLNLTDSIGIRSGGTTQLAVMFNASGFAQVRRGGTVIGTASVGAITASTYYFVELRAVLDPSVGSAVVRLNEVEVLNIPVANTVASGVAGWDSVLLSTANVFSQVSDFDDLYILDGSATAPNNFLGDCRVDARYPTAEGAASAWTPLSGTDNALMVDETAPDDDTTYTSTPTVGATDTHVVQDAPLVGGIVYGVQLCLSQKKTDAGTCAIAPVVRHGSTDYAGTAVNPTTSYAYACTPYGLNPGTGAAWTEAHFNAAEFGYTRTA